MICEKCKKQTDELNIIGHSLYCETCWDDDLTSDGWIEDDSFNYYVKHTEPTNPFIKSKGIHIKTNGAIIIRNEQP